VEKMIVEIILFIRGVKMSLKKRITMILSILIVVLVFIFATTEQEEAQHSYKDKIIRLHVIANSDTPDDQELKLKVRDEIIKSLNERLTAYGNIEESRNFIRENIREIKETASNTLIQNGHTYPVQAQLEMTWIPEKTYGNLTLPAGNYEALNVIIGEGKGENWWCVLFPPLCLIESPDSQLGDIQEALAETLTQEEYQILVNETKEDTPVLRLKFKTLETAEELKADIEKLINKFNKEKASIY